MVEITWAMWSCSGLLLTSSPQIKVDFLFSCNDTKLDLAILVLTHHKDFQEISSLPQTLMNSTCIIQTRTTEGDPYAGIAVWNSSKFTLLEPTTLLQGMLLNFKIRWYKKNCNANDPQLEAPEMQDLVDCPSSCRHAQSQNHYYTDANMIIKLKYEFLFQNHPT